MYIVSCCFTQRDILNKLTRRRNAFIMLDLFEFCLYRWYYFCQLPYFPEREEMKQDLMIFDKIFARLFNSKRGNLTEQDIEAFKYTFSRLGW
jgi:hypothetical protein